MAKEGLESVHSSIALLQERFRQLQRAKEIREERELLRQMSESEKAIFLGAKHYYYEPIGLFLQSGFAVPHFYKPPPKTQGSISMCLNPSLQSKQRNYLQVFDETPVLQLTNMCSNTVASLKRTNSLDDSDVDTSLHL